MEFQSSKSILVSLPSFNKADILKMRSILLDTINKSIIDFKLEYECLSESTIDISSGDSKVKFDTVEDFIKNFSPNSKVDFCDIACSVMVGFTNLLRLYISATLKPNNDGVECKFHLSSKSCLTQIVSEEALFELNSKLENFSITSLPEKIDAAPIDVRVTASDIGVSVTTSDNERTYQENVSRLDQRVQLKHLIIGCVLTFILGVLSAVICFQLLSPAIPK